MHIEACDSPTEHAVLETKECETSIERPGLGHWMKGGSLGAATKALSREGVGRLVDDGVGDLTLPKLEVTPDNVRDDVENNVRINVDISRYLAPSTPTPRTHPRSAAKTIDAAAPVFTARGSHSSETFPATSSVPNAGSGRSRRPIPAARRLRAAEDPVAFVRDHHARISQVHIPDYPGRQEPGTGSFDFEIFFRTLDAAGCAGSVGLEYRPAGETAAGLGCRARLA